MVDIEDKLWKPFIGSIAEYLGITADLLPKAQIFFSYAGRKVLSVTDAKPIEVKDHLMLAYGQAESKTDISNTTDAQKRAMLSDPLTTFEYAFEATPGSRSLALIRAAKHARDLGLSTDELVELMYEINDYWDYPLDDRRIQTTIIDQILRW
jgi:hypothetical protein